jgi:uncharacterized protein (DUF433 family)
MTLNLDQQPTALVVTPEGIIRIDGTRVPLETIVRAFHHGSTAEEIAQDYPTVSLAKVYTVLAYYLWHREEVDRYIAQRSAASDAARLAHEQQFDPAGIRARLLARQRATEQAA